VEKLALIREMKVWEKLLNLEFHCFGSIVVTQLVLLLFVKTHQNLTKNLDCSLLDECQFLGY
jgi:hypothetical protein